jgi:hypothetical protein
VAAQRRDFSVVRSLRERLLHDRKRETILRSAIPQVSHRSSPAREKLC